jgi:hypothetical protein
LWSDEVKNSGAVTAAQTQSSQPPQGSPASAQNYWNR